MNLNPHHVSKARKERYAQWERAAPVTCIVVAIAAVVSAYFFRPNILVIVGPFVAGIANFLSWQAGLQEHNEKVLIFAVISMILAMAGVVFAGNVSLLVMIAQSFPWVLLGLFVPIWFARNRNQKL